MSDSEIPQDNSDHERAGSDQSPAPSTIGAQDGGGSLAQPTPASRPSIDGGEEHKPVAKHKSLASHFAGTRERVAAAVAVLCLLVGAIASVLGAHAVASSDNTKARASFQQSSTAIASAARLAIQRQEELTVSTSTFFANNPQATPTEFARWVRWARTLRRFPELDSLGLITVVSKPRLAALEARVTGHATKADEGVQITPASNHRYYCLAATELARNAAVAAPAGLDYCAQSPTLLLARDVASSRYAPFSAQGTPALAIEVPVYRGTVTPRSTFGRQAASVGWLREVIVPGVVLATVLGGHPQSAAQLSYASAGFTSGTPQPGAQTKTTALHDGWTLTSFGAPANAGVLSDGDALALLIGGIALSALLGALVLMLVLGVSRAPARAPRTSTREVPNEDLYDRLTGLPNRALMLDRAECMLARAGRQSGLLVGALFIDIDWFKDVNEKLGQAAGDQLLAAVADRLAAVVRAGDTVGRLGGDEFVILVESAARGARLDSLARRVIETLHKPFELEDFGPNFFMTASIGLAFGRYDGPEDLLRDAQLALYAAKAAGKDRYTLFNANMRSVIEGRGVLEVELNAALQDRQFFLLYQPVYDLNTGKVAGLEARIRWLHPKQGELAPADFMPLAEETGLIVPIGRWMLEEACSRAAAWNVAGHRAGVSVQVTAAQLNREGFATDVRRALQQSGIEPCLLTLEVAETTVMSDVSAAVERLEEIKRLGVRIAIDDFGGSGYAYHSDLRRLPLDFLNVDRSSLAASDDEDYRTWLLEAILIVGRDLSLTVIAKGIETYEQLTTLQTMGCTMAQGLFMGKPTPAHAVEGLFNVDLPTARATAPELPSS